MTLTTDFGLRDWYVAAMKGVVLSRAPETRLVDLSHDVAPGDVATAAFLLQAAAPTFPNGTVHLAVVDPGVGTDRRILAVDAVVADGADERSQVFVAPDNGLLDPFVERARQVVAVDRPDLYRDAPGHTFHGRDRFAPVAAALALGEKPEQLGSAVTDPRRLGTDPPRHTGDLLRGTVRHVDRFGNLVTDLPAAWLAGYRSGEFEAEIAGHVTELRADAYRQIPAGRAAVLIGSLGTLELSLDGADLAGAWGVGRGAPVRIRLRSDSNPPMSRTGGTPAKGEP